jgi:hypothetical protein
MAMVISANSPSAGRRRRDASLATTTEAACETAGARGKGVLSCGRVRVGTDGGTGGSMVNGSTGRACPCHERARRLAWRSGQGQIATPRGASDVGPRWTGGAQGTPHTSLCPGRPPPLRRPPRNYRLAPGPARGRTPPVPVSPWHAVAVPPFARRRGGKRTAAQSGPVWHS